MRTVWNRNEWKIVEKANTLGVEYVEEEEELFVNSPLMSLEEVPALCWP